MLEPPGVLCHVFQIKDRPWTDYPSLILIKSAPSLFAQPSGLHVFPEERAGAVFRILESVIKGLHDSKACIQPYQVCQRQWPHRMIGPKPHDRVYVLSGAHAVIKAVDRLIDHGHQYPVSDKTRIVVCEGRGFAESF